MIETVTAAILALAPYVGEAQAKAYSKLIVREVRSVSPLVVVAITFHESRFKRRQRSATNDFGLMQVHVSATTNPKYRGRHAELYAPRLNFRLGIRLLELWKRYHYRHAGGQPHHWWSHYKWGGIVKNRRYGLAVEAHLRRIIAPPAGV